MDIWRESHPRVTRSTPQFVLSPQFFTRFRRRHGFSTTQHKVEKVARRTEEQENQRIDETAEYLMRVDDAVQQHGARQVINADETMGRAVEQPRKSWGERGKRNIVNTTMDRRRGITTTPSIAADGTKLPLQAIAKGKTQRTVINKHFPSGVVGDHSASGWQTSKTAANLINNVIAPHTRDQPSSLILDDYKAHSTAAVKDAAAAHNIDLISVPGGQTSVLQPLDVSVNGEIKQRARRKWVKDKQSGRENSDTLTRAVERVNDAYHAVPSAHITSSFSKAVPALRLPR